MHRSLLVVLALFTAACGGSSATSESSADHRAGEPASTAGAEEAWPEPDIDGPEARALVAEGAMLIDVTPADRSSSSAIEGAINIPLGEVQARMDEIPRDRPVVVYCLGGGGSPRAVQLLRAAGYTNVRLLGARERWDNP